ncbi:MAG: hypothetical protein ACJAVV_000753 [Alphaproteobacteria bacterium]|jgi:hypothetical protein
MLKKLLCGATLLCAATFSNAGTIVLSDEVTLQTTNFQTSLSFAQFDTMGGTRVLDSVSFSIDGSIFGDISVESRDAAAATITTRLSAELTLTDALMNTLVVTIPSIERILNATSFDGDVDFGGTSGATYADLEATQFNQETYSDAATLALFTGMGFSDFTFDAAATSVATGAGSITSAFNTSASGLVEVIYTYSDTVTQVSAPSHVAFLGLGVLAFAGLRKVRK